MPIERIKTRRQKPARRPSRSAARKKRRTWNDKWPYGPKRHSTKWTERRRDASGRTNTTDQTATQTWKDYLGWSGWRDPWSRDGDGAAAPRSAPSRRSAPRSACAAKWRYGRDAAAAGSKWWPGVNATCRAAIWTCLIYRQRPVWARTWHLTHRLTSWWSRWLRGGGVTSAAPGCCSCLAVHWWVPYYSEKKRNRSINQSINRWTNQSINQPINRPEFRKTINSQQNQTYRSIYIRLSIDPVWNVICTTIAT